MEATTVPKKRGRPKKAITALESDLPGDTPRRSKSTKATSSSPKSSNATVKPPTTSEPAISPPKKPTKARSSGGTMEKASMASSLAKSSKILQELAGLDSSVPKSDSNVEPIPQNPAIKKHVSESMLQKATIKKEDRLSSAMTRKIYPKQYASATPTANAKAIVPQSPVKPATPTIAPTAHALPTKTSLPNGPTINPIEPSTAPPDQVVPTSRVTGQQADATKMPPRIGAGQIPKSHSYRSLSIRFTIAMCATPIAAYMSYLLYERVILGKEPLKAPQWPVEKKPATEFVEEKKVLE